MWRMQIFCLRDFGRELWKENSCVADMHGNGEELMEMEAGWHFTTST